MTRTQAERTVSIETPLGPDALLFKSMRLTEGLGRPFHADLELLSEDHAVDFSQVVGHNVTVRLELADGSPRFFNGYVSRMAQSTGTSLLARYQATVVPWLWFLTRTSDCRIFQQKAVPDIVKEIFQENGFADVVDNLSGSYAPWEYCVQYRETDFNFVSRLMEHEGIYYYFKHEQGVHSIVLCDAPGAHPPCPGYDAIDFRPDGAAAAGEYVYEWSVEQAVQPGRVVLNDYDFTAPKKKLLAQAELARPHAQAGHEIYDYPGEYVDPGDGTDYSAVRLQELQAQHEIATGATDAMGVLVGHTFALGEFPRDDQNKSYLVTSAESELTGDDADSGGGGGPVLRCRFTAVDATAQYRPPRATPKPVVQGPQTAVVVGPAGEEIYVDEHGRVKVQFHWDRYGTNDENSSCWVRVSQEWAGKQWGAVYHPRIGQEVVVSFLEGDPDLPLVTGRVYNGDNPPPYGLPANRTQSGVKTRSSKGGSPANFNEIRFEDKKGSEQLYVHAEKNQDVVVENDKTESVGHDETITIENDRTETVGHDETITVQNDRVDTVNANETRTVVKDRTRTVSRNETVTVAMMRTHTVGINEAITVGAAQEVTVGGLQAITVGASQVNTVGVHQENTVGGSRSTSVGRNDTLKVGKVLTIEAEDEVLIKTGAASIHMKKDGSIQIKGKDIQVDGSGKLSLKASGNVTIKGSKIAAN